MPVRGLCANNRATSTSPEHCHHLTHSEDDCGGKQTPQIARVDEMGDGFLSLGAVTWVTWVVVGLKSCVPSKDSGLQRVAKSTLLDSTQPAHLSCHILPQLRDSFQKIYLKCFVIFSYMLRGVGFLTGSTTLTVEKNLSGKFILTWWRAHLWTSNCSAFKTVSKFCCEDVGRYFVSSRKVLLGLFHSVLSFSILALSNNV